MGKTGKLVLAVVLAAVILSGVSLFSTYNRLVGLSEGVDAAWAQVENQLQRRYDLVPNLVETVKGYASHERQVFDSIAQARTQYAGAQSADERARAATGLESALARLLVIVENYPNLKADREFIRLMDELSGTENRIAVERRRFNEVVQEYNKTIKRIPTRFVAAATGFGTREYFRSSTEAQEAPKVTF
ncbi:MAG: LemA family protein [Firmicutes bacterium]|nr:LemA family protein [Bacillota bacterium]